MAASRLTALALRSAPATLLVLLEAWVAWDLASIPDRRWSVGLFLLFLSNLGFLALGRVIHRPWARSIGLVILGSAYVIAHASVLGIELVPALAVVSLVIAQVEVRILAERFAPLFIETITPAQQKQIGRALFRAIVRLIIASILSVALPLLAADLAIAGIFPVTTIPTALLLSAGLVAVVLIIALLPTLEARTEGKG